jgi:putative phosphoribosyl transferase
MIVGGRDREVIGMNEAASARMNCEREIQIVPGATHLFEEPGTLEEVARLATGWFERFLPVS